MADLIDREALMEDIGENVVVTVRHGKPSAELRGASKIIDRIEAASTIDAVEVVRCKDCKHMSTEPIGRYCHVWGFFNGAGDDGFCNYGERRESNGK